MKSRKLYSSEDRDFPANPIFLQTLLQKNRVNDYGRISQSPLRDAVNRVNDYGLISQSPLRDAVNRVNYYGLISQSPLRDAVGS